MCRDRMPKWAKDMDYEDLPTWLQETLWDNESELTASENECFHDDCDSLPDNPELHEIYGKLCHIAQSMWINHQADVCDDCFFHVEFADGPLMTSPGARRIANQIFQIFGLN